MTWHLAQGIASRIRAWRFRLHGMRIDGKVWLRKVEVPRQVHRITLAGGAALDRGVTLIVSGAPDAAPAIQIGRTYINRNTIIDACQEVRIGNDCMVGPFCYITDHDHTAGPDGSFGTGPLVSRPVVLEDRSWIGAHVTILKGVRVGKGAVVGAGSVVTKDVPPGVVVAGNPARVLAARGIHNP